MKFSDSAVKLACEIIGRDILTKEELEAIIDSGVAPRELYELARSILYKDKSPYSKSEGGKNGSERGDA